jgi:arylformamidase
MVEILRSAARAYWEAEYNPRVRVPDAQRYFDAWSSRAAGARARLPGILDVAYGVDLRERFDLFRADDARGTLVFVHGGYWRAFGKEAFSWVAEPFVRAGISVVIPSYPLSPAVRLKDIVRSLAAAVSHVQCAILTPEERRSTILVGHSAGAHLSACLLAAAQGDPAGPAGPAIDGIVCISGLFDLLPLLHTEMLSGMGWEPEELHAASPLFMPEPAGGTVILAVGGDETAEFHAQSARFARAWAQRVVGVWRPTGRDHFSVVDDLHGGDYELTRMAIDLLSGRSNQSPRDDAPRVTDF